MKRNPPPRVVASRRVSLALELLYQFWLHSERVPKLGWLEWVLDPPSHHRVHHATNQHYLDRNFGGTLIVFDRLFGIFIAERSDTPCPIHRPAQIGGDGPG